ncbi:MAG: hypothetical protein NVS3B3_11400 [Aquirhabdus sp.]
MIKRSISDLHFVNGREPLPTVEIQMESLEKQGLQFDQIIASTLTRFAAENITSKATVYLYGTYSVNFHEQSWSEFLIVAGDKKVLPVLEYAFSVIPGVKSKSSESIVPSTGVKFFHIEGGLLWEPEDASTWYATSQEETEKDQDSVNKVATTAGIVERHNEDYNLDDVIIGRSQRLEQNSSDIPAVGRQPEQPARYRAARSTASIASIRLTIEQLFDLPEGSVALCGPDGRPLRSDAFIKTLRRRWE